MQPPAPHLLEEGPQARSSLVPDDRGIFAPGHPLWVERYAKAQVDVFAFLRDWIVHANVARALLSYGQIVVGEVKEPHPNRTFSNWALRSTIQEERQIDEHCTPFDYS